MSDVIQVHMIETWDHEISIDPDPQNTFFQKLYIGPYIGEYVYSVSLLLLRGRNC